MKPFFSRRRLAFQLTPLLDLMLIVIFAQYMEMQEVAAKQKADSDQKVAAMTATVESQQVEIQHEREAEKQILKAEQDRIAEERAQFETRQAELEDSLKQVIEREQQSAEIVAQIFNVPEELLKETFGRTSPNEPARSAEELEQLRARFREMSGEHGSQVIRHLLTYDELRKRSDVWDLYVAENGTITLSTGSNSTSFRAETIDEFEQRMFTAYKSLPEPKSLVVVLVSYGDARLSTRQPVLQGLPRAFDRMRSDSAGRTRFEYRILGYSPLAPAGNAN